MQGGTTNRRAVGGSRDASTERPWSQASPVGGSQGQIHKEGAGSADGARQAETSVHPLLRPPQAEAGGFHRGSTGNGGYGTERGLKRRNDTLEVGDGAFWSVVHDVGGFYWGCLFSVFF